MSASNLLPPRWGVFLVAALAAAPMLFAQHGATPMDAQQSRLHTLQKDRDWSQPPAGVDPQSWKAHIPADNELTDARVDLGRSLYFDVRLSKDNSVSCATCHDVGRGFTDQRMVSEGIGGKLGRRNAPTTLNAALIKPQFLDGRATSLEHQAGMPILNPIEMGMTSEAEVVAKLKTIPEYTKAFQAAYGRDIHYEDIQRAIASFERTLIFLDAPIDAYLSGDTEALSEDAAAGFILFNGKARCVACHQINPSNPLGTDFRFHNIGVSARNQDFEGLARKALKSLEADPSEAGLDRLALETDMSELGRFMITKNQSDIGAFRTLQLRNIGLTGPYMHDGSLRTLWDVMDHYNKGGEANPFLDGGIEPLALTETEIDQVVAFMFSLTDRAFAQENARAMNEQKAQAAKTRPFRDTELAMRKTVRFGDVGGAK